jgi:hypothetical protein
VASHGDAHHFSRAAASWTMLRSAWRWISIGPFKEAELALDLDIGLQRPVLQEIRFSPAAAASSRMAQ